jgi:DNA (cytosine-5)-methyltransferase 1
MRAVKEKKPQYFIWENVKGALSSQGGWDFAAVLNEMAEAGYSLWWQVLNAKDFGVPQNRERVFVVGFRDRSAPEVFFERGGGEVDNGKDEQGNAYCLNAGGDKHRGTYIKQLNNPTHSNNRLYSDEGISPALNTAQGGNRQPKIPQGAKIRRLTETECEALMALPKDWTKYGSFKDGDKEISSTQRYKLCGNGVVVNVVEELVKTLILNEL